MRKYYTSENKKHNYGDHSRISPKLLNELEDLAAWVGQELLITSGYRPNDSSSQHRIGLAVDVVPTVAMNLLDLYLAAERFEFIGIGVYPDWSNGKQKTGGLHLDMRESAFGARWIGARNSDGKNEYVALSFDNLKKLGII